MLNKKLSLYPFLMGFCILVFSISSCNNAKKDYGSLKIVFDHKIGDKDFVLGKFIYNSKSGYKYETTTLRYFTSNFKLFKTDKSFIEYDTFHYREVGDKYKYTRELVFDKFPVGKYNGISFIHGLDSQYNKPIKGNEASSLPNNVDEYNDMYWPWQKDGQYHYMKYEGAYIKGGDTLSFKLHTGPTNGEQNFIEIDKIPFKERNILKGDTLVIHLSMDLNQWIEDPITYDFNKFGKGIMNVQEAQDILKKNGKNVYSVVSVSVK